MGKFLEKASIQTNGSSMKKGKAVNEAYKGVVDLIGNGGIYFNVIFFFCM